MLLQGVLIMCRRNQLCGLGMLCFGIGLLIGLWVNCGFLAHCIGFGCVICGCCLLKKK